MKGPRWPRVAAAATGFIWFVHVCGASTLHPANTDWLFVGDWRQHWLGFLFFQREPWSFPLGGLTSLLYPIGTNIAFTDSNPLLAILVKPFAGLLPDEYQLMGPWLAACFVMQGYLGAALASTMTKNPVQQAFGGCIFVMSPALYGRLGHDTLCAHAILLSLLYMGLRENTRDRREARAPWLTTLALICAAAVHPYLAVMSWVLAQAVLIKLWRSGSLAARLTLVWMFGSTAAMLSVWAVIGYFGSTLDGHGGFGHFSSDLLTLIDPNGYSRILPDLPTTIGEGEGFAFLGVGGLVALMLAVAAALKHRPALRPGMGVIAIACVLLAVFALSSSVKLAGEEVVNLESVYEPLQAFVEPFRSSGRFIWPLHYLLLTFGLWGVTRLFSADRRSAATMALASIVFVQAADVRDIPWWLTKKPERQIVVETFDLARGSYRHLALVPPQVVGTCGAQFEDDYVFRFMLLAHRLKLTFNSGDSARLDAGATRRACEAQDRAVDAGTLDPHTIYVTTADHVGRFKATGKAACGRWDGYWYCVERESHPRFATFIEGGKDPGRAP